MGGKESREKAALADRNKANLEKVRAENEKKKAQSETDKTESPSPGPAQPVVVQ